MRRARGRAKRASRERPCAITQAPRIPSRGQRLARKLATSSSASVATAATEGELNCSAADLWPAERQSLVELVAQSGPAPTAPVCSWAFPLYVECWPHDCRVMYVHFPHIAGTLPASLAGLASLRELDLSGAQISGTLDAALAAWTSLQKLTLPETLVSGTLSCALAAWTSLTSVNIKGTRVSGTICAALSAWTRLQTAVFVDTQLSGTLAPGLAAWTCLQFAMMSNTQVSGTLHPAFAAWTQLRNIELGSTQLSGTLPSELGAWSLLEQLGVAGTQMSGTLDAAFANWTALVRLNADTTLVSGTLHPAFARWSTIGYLQLTATPVSGELSVDFSAWTALAILHLAITQVSGTLPPALASWAHVYGIGVYSTAISGTLDPAFSRWTSLEFLDISYSRISGTLGAAFGAGWQWLLYLRASNSRLECVAPAVFQLPARLVDLSYAKLNFTAPGCRPQGARSVALDLSGNAWNVDFAVVAKALAAQANPGVSRLTLRDMGMTGPVDAGQPTPISASIVSLRLDGNALGCHLQLPPFLEELSLARMPSLANCYSADTAPVPPRINASYTPARYCYDGAALSAPSTLVLSVRGVRPAPTCNRARERNVMGSTFFDCARAPARDPMVIQALNRTLCTLAGSKVAFTESNL
jgi:hypothetical protein